MPLQHALGERIKKRREQMQLSLRALAQQTHVSASFLSQLERGQASPSLSTLQALADVLQVPLFYFLLDDASDEYIVRSGQGPRFDLPGAQIGYELRSPSPVRKMLVFVGAMDPGYIHQAVMPAESTQETIYVLRGALTIELDDGLYSLDPGDSITFDGRDLVCVSNQGEAETRYLSFVMPPAFW